jgi:hypothetical protein
MATASERKPRVVGIWITATPCSLHIGNDSPEFESDPAKYFEAWSRNRHYLMMALPENAVQFTLVNNS